jgi:hypothetical protein
MKLVKEYLNEKFTEDSDPIKDMGIGLKDYSEAAYKLDNYMPEDKDLMNEYYEILNSDEGVYTKINKLTSFLQEYINDQLFRYFPKEGTINGFAEYIIYST